MLLGGLAVWESYAGALPAIPDRWDVALTALLLLPWAFAVVWLLLPLANGRFPIAGAVTIGLLALLLSLAGSEGPFNVAKLLAYALAGFAFLILFEALSWVVLVSVIVPWVDIGSVYQGPTKVVTEQKPDLFEKIAISFRLPGEDASANIGPPDILFFALFLATAKRFGLRVGWTWLAMTAFLSLTLVATYVFELNGLPALPAVSFGFLLPNADLLGRAWRAQRAASSGP